MKGLFSRRVLLFAIYGMALTMVLAYLRFPGEDFRRWLEGELSARFSPMSVRLERITLDWPLALQLSGILIQEEQQEKVFLHINRLSLRPLGLDRLDRWEVAAALYGGEILATLDFDLGARNLVADDIRGSLLDLSLWELPAGQLGRSLSGQLSFAASYRAELQRPFAGQGRGQIVAKEGEVELLESVFSLSKLIFNEVSADLEYREGKMELLDGKLSGRDLSGFFTGNVQFTEPFAKSLVALEGGLVPEPKFLAANAGRRRAYTSYIRRFDEKYLPFKMGGVLARPTFRMGQR